MTKKMTRLRSHCWPKPLSYFHHRREREHEHEHGASETTEKSDIMYTIACLPACLPACSLHCMEKRAKKYREATFQLGPHRHSRRLDRNVFARRPRDAFLFPRPTPSYVRTV